MVSSAEREEVMRNYDLYELIGTSDSPSESEIRKAYRKQALKYHPDKNKSKKAVDIFHALSIALEILTDESLRQEYDNKRSAKVALKKRQEAFDLRRRQMQEDLENRENDSIRRSKSSGPVSMPRTNNPEREAKLRRLREQSAMLRTQRDARIRSESHR
ncbi:DnaJ domain-containing protein [Dipodascopsis uninucleata]